MPLADTLLAGVRGRRVLLEFALESAHRRDAAAMSLTTAVLTAAENCEPPGTTVWIGDGARPPLPEPATPGEVAELLMQVPLAHPSPQRLRAALARSVDVARYWQEPDGTDQVAATPEVRGALLRVAEHLAPAVAGWWRPIERDDQWAVQWDDDRMHPPSPLSVDALRDTRDRQAEEERRAQHDRPADPTANMSGDWWSMPNWQAPSTAGVTFDGSPAALWFVEDSMGWERGLMHRATISADARVLEIDDQRVWGDLCARFPLVVTASRRHDWYRATGRIGEWVLPDWAAVAEHYDGAHLQTGAYLAAAGAAIPVGKESASVIAGWNPDQTFWLTAGVGFEAEPVSWVSANGGDGEWMPSPLP